LANILPRLASMTAFLCFVVAHFEWPDISYLRLLARVPRHTQSRLMIHAAAAP